MRSVFSCCCSTRRPTTGFPMAHSRDGRPKEWRVVGVMILSRGEGRDPEWTENVFAEARPRTRRSQSLYATLLRPPWLPPTPIPRACRLSTMLSATHRERVVSIALHSTRFDVWNVPYALAAAPSAALITRGVEER